ncbi:unnamed protein product [Rotaria sordida]|uniref:Uncharacterized protein n=1 Tax=Rotaria sordida TaxID=392033 RepID=A0A815II55_9BILA|nr:unnamed protein product [Rotaria sordida]
MILEVEKGHDTWTEHMFFDLYEMKTLFWACTVQLTLSIQYPFELVIILQNGAIPLLEHLYVTIEQEQYISKPYSKKPEPDIQLCERDIRQMANATRLQTLVLRHLALSHLIILLNSLNMPLLKKLTLVDIFDETLENLDEFRRAVGYNHLPVLKHLYFLIRFPGNLNEILHTSLITYGNIWPFNNLTKSMN